MTCIKEKKKGDPLTLMSLLENFQTPFQTFDFAIFVAIQFFIFENINRYSNYTKYADGFKNILIGK